ncbi:hypothetical protein MMC20_002717 [Loxospora ochrophaea]|nr:hypothetical protein [Loxospora ochrophaea]
MEPSFAQQWYASRAPTYDDSWHPRHAADFVRWAQLRPGQHCLDLACGTGLVTIPAKKAVGNTGTVTAIDITDGMMDLAKAKAENESLDIAFINHDITKLDTLNLRHGAYDLITCASALPLLSDPAAAIKLWSNYLAKDGLLIVDLPTEDSQVVGLTFEEIGPELGLVVPYGRTWLKSIDSLAQMVANAGLDIERSWRTDTYTSVIEYPISNGGYEFDKRMDNIVYANFAKHETREKARELFEQKFRSKANAAGIVRDEDCFYVVIGKKP